ncbi:cytochrome c biogenesis factor [Synechococcus sp. PCC 7502]|uniref:tetratricopeptide repeat protein n=1 Tax=Synechococcus sp. PCC 7502 TaxID=1173263 RepID=UPI00029F811C|nr:tetratricopeptide repeat protein [Synechococcus sp. PCC 7502]AFY75244.1 cytochrome c biogenesis factor [Synechococcus sp. PCC 7502]
MNYRLPLTAALVTLTYGMTLANAVNPVNAQALIPHTIKLNFGNVETQALALARDAAQLAQFQQYDLALSRARLAVQLSPQSYQTQAVLGSIYLRTEEYPKAIASFSNALNLKKDNASIFFSLGAAYLRNTNYQLAIDKLKQGLTLAPKSPTALFDLGNAYFLTKRYDEAIAEFNQVLKLEDKFWAATNNIGLVEYERGNVDIAIKKWEESIAQGETIEDKAAESRLALGIATYIKGDRPKGLRLAEEALKIDVRYGKPEFLKENLWGDKLLADAKTILATPTLKTLVDQSNIPLTKNDPKNTPKKS